MKKATAAISQGMGGAFLQTSAASVLKQLSITMDISSMDREMITSFLTQGQASASGYAPASGQIVGILKQMTDTMEKDLADATAAEEAAIKDFKGLVAAKTKEINALTKEVETKTAQIGELGVQLVIQVLLLGHQLHTKLTNLCSLRFNFLGQSINLFSLCRDQTFEILDGGLFSGCCICQILLHRISHLLQDAHNLATSWRVTRSRSLALCEEGGDHLTIHGADVHRDRQLLQHRCCRGLQESTTHALRDGSSCLFHGSNVCLELAALCCECASFLLSQSSRFGDSVFCRCTAFLC